MKTRTKGEMGAAKSLCTPFDQPEIPEGTMSVILCYEWYNTIAMTKT